jgi:hypothetical protein
LGGVPIDESAEIIQSLGNDKIGRYYLVYDILLRCDEALGGKFESSPAKEYQDNVKNTLDTFETSVRKEATRRKL